MRDTKAFLEKLETHEFIDIPDTVDVPKGKPNNECLNCQWLGVYCSGPNAATMTVERICEFLQYSRLQKKWSYQRTATECNLALVTVKRTLTGHVKNPEFLTIQCLFEGLVGNGKYPCSKLIMEQQADDKQAIHAAEIAAKDEIISDLKLQLKELRETNATYRSNIADLRAQVKKYETAAKKAQKQ